MNSLSAQGQRAITILMMSTIAVAVVVGLSACGPSGQEPGFASPYSASRATAPRLPVAEAHGSLQYPPPATRPDPIEATPATTARGPISINGAAPTALRPMCAAAPASAGSPATPSYFPATTQEPEGMICPKCYEGSFEQADPRTNKIDFVFVAETTPSLASMRAAIAAGIGETISKLPSGTDYHIAVIAAHSDVRFDGKPARDASGKPSSGLGGKLIGGNSPVLKSSDFNGNMTALAAALRQRIMNMPSDPATDGGEAGLYSLDLAITGDQLRANQEKGMFRPDATQVVVFFSDENDICATNVYPDGSRHRNRDIVRAATADAPELNVEEKAHDFYCKGNRGDGVEREPVTPQSVYAKLARLKARTQAPAGAGGVEAQPESQVAAPLLIAGIVYANEETVPTMEQMPPNEPFRQYWHEKQKGHGFLDLIELANGEKVDLGELGARPTTQQTAQFFTAGMRKIGDAAAIRMTEKRDFRLAQGVSVDPQTICAVVEVANGSRGVDYRDVPRVENFDAQTGNLAFVFREDTRTMQLRAVGPLNTRDGKLRVSAWYCEPPSQYRLRRELHQNLFVPTQAQHYGLLPAPSACTSVKRRLGELSRGETPSVVVAPAPAAAAPAQPPRPVNPPRPAAPQQARPQSGQSSPR